MLLSSSYQQFMPLTRSLSFEHLASPGYLLLPQSIGLFGIRIAVFFNQCFLRAAENWDRVESCPVFFLGILYCDPFLLCCQPSRF